MSHTPGPWAWGEYFQGLHGASGAVLDWAPYEGMHLDGDEKANAALIAAAPDLLAALIHLLRDEATLDDDDPKLIATRFRAYEAIAKAEGK